MKIKKSSSGKMRRCLTRLGVVGIPVVIAALAVSANGWLARHIPLASSFAGSASRAVQDNRRERVEVEVITLRPTGFDPNEITRPAGSVLLAASNRSGLEEVVLWFDRVGGTRLHELRVSRKRKDWRGVVDLKPGRYILSEASHPDWTCQITITAQ